MIMSTKVEDFLVKTMKDSYKTSEDGDIKKYYNDEFDVVLEKKTGKAFVIDKRHPQRTIYNDVTLAFKHLNSQSLSALVRPLPPSRSLRKAPHLV